MIALRLSLLSLRNRWGTAVLTVLAISLSIALLLGVEKVRTGARQSFTDTISGTDLIVGARSGSLNLLLYSVFRIGNATNNISWASLDEIAKSPDIAWIVPLSLGDAHRGFRVLGTSVDYFKYYKYRRDQKLAFAAGAPFVDLFDAVIGADVAAKLGYKVGDRMVVAHGLGNVAFVEHDDKPFIVSGVLAKTGTPADRTVHVSLEAIEAIHLDWQSGIRNPDSGSSVDAVRQMKLTPKSVTAAMIGLKSRIATFKLQRSINEYTNEALSAIVPGAALQELWGLVGTAESALSAVSAMVVLTALLGMLTMILTTLNGRRREMAILRSVGAGPGTILTMLVAESAVLVTAGVISGAVFLYVALLWVQPFVDRYYGLYLPLGSPNSYELMLLCGVVLVGVLSGLLPALRAYRLSLSDGMMVRN